MSFLAVSNAPVYNLQWNCPYCRRYELVRLSGEGLFVNGVVTCATCGKTYKAPPFVLGGKGKK